MRIDKVVDPLTRQLVGYRISMRRRPASASIWLDGRPSPSPYALHSWDGFSTGKFRGDTLEITTTHLKESYVRRNGVATSFRATVIEHMSLEEPHSEVTFTVIDPDYLTEPLVRSATRICARPRCSCRRIRVSRRTISPVRSTAFRITCRARIRISPSRASSTRRHRRACEAAPTRSIRNGARAARRWRRRRRNPTIKPAYTDASTRIAERADALRPRAPYV